MQLVKNHLAAHDLKDTCITGSGCRRVPLACTTAVLPHQQQLEVPSTHPATTYPGALSSMHTSLPCSTHTNIHTHTYIHRHTSPRIKVAAALVVSLTSLLSS